MCRCAHCATLHGSEKKLHNFSYKPARIYMPNQILLNFMVGEIQTQILLVLLQAGCRKRKRKFPFKLLTLLLSLPPFSFEVLDIGYS